MDELQLLLIRLEDLSESSQDREVQTLAKALKRYFTAQKDTKIGFKAK